jgi:3-deoxy-D-manno-octulosonate 8-phosphate phosphatase (KDO 8-P phosphatase)
MTRSLRGKMKRIRMIVMDVDGVLTDGRIIYDNAGGEYKIFDAHDGYGITRAQKKGMLFAIITARKSKATKKRVEELRITELHQDAKDKLTIFNKLKSRHKLKSAEMCYIGDDEIDLGVLKAVGVSAAPCDAMSEVRSAVDYVTAAAGGRGAVRELIDCILQAKGIL